MGLGWGAFIPHVSCFLKKQSPFCSNSVPPLVVGSSVPFEEDEWANLLGDWKEEMRKLKLG